VASRTVAEIRVSGTGHHGPLQTKVFSQYKGVTTKAFRRDRSTMVPQKRAAIYARVSAVDKGQNPTT
jgi:hypothetical protein